VAACIPFHTGLGHHRYEWLHVTAFVQPTSGEAVWYLSTGLSKPLFEALLAAFARQTGAGRRRSIILVLDNAGWHGPEGLADRACSGREPISSTVSDGFLHRLLRRGRRWVGSGPSAVEDHAGVVIRRLPLPTLPR
jgi:hypothetical protein